MLVLSRQVGEVIKIGDNIEVVVVEIVNTKVRLGINAPREVRIMRSELLTAQKADAGERK